MMPGRRPSKRGTSIQFGPNITEEFCIRNGLEYIIRSHEVKQEGYEEAHNKRCYTIFSAPNYGKFETKNKHRIGFMERITIFQTFSLRSNGQSRCLYSYTRS